MNDPAQRLPSETFASVLSYLSPACLTRCARVSRVWSAFCDDQALWKDLLLRLHYFVPLEDGASNLVAVTGTLQLHTPFEREKHSLQSILQQAIQRYKDRNVTAYFDGCNTFRSLCCQLWKLECNWTARSHSFGLEPEVCEPERHHNVESEKSLSSPTDELPEKLPIDVPGLDPYLDTFELPRDGPGAWRLKLDPVEGTIITTGQSGGVQVYDHRTKMLLWHIPKTATRPSPHLEFSNGYIVFDRPGLGHFEVWRSERLVPDLNRAPDRGHYQRLCVLSSTRPIRAYRFQYPILAMASQTGFIEMWNVLDGVIVETINVTSSIHRDGNITYIDFDDEYVFLTGMGAKSVSVFSRQSQQLVWNMGQHFAKGSLRPPTFSIRSKGAHTSTMFEEQEFSPTSANLWQDGPNTMNLAQLTMMPWQIWSAIHPDYKTKTLAVLGQGTVLLIRDYKEYFRNTARPPKLFVEIELWNLQTYYAQMLSQESFDREVREEPITFSEYVAQRWNSRRLWEQIPEAQMTVNEGKVFIINDFPIILDLKGLLSSDSQGVAQLNGNDSEWPLIRVWKDRASDDELKREAWKVCSCVQMDETGIYYIGELDEQLPLLFGPPVRRTRIIRHLDFTRTSSERDSMTAGQSPSAILQTYRPVT